MMLFLEILAVILNVAFVVFIGLRRIWGWIPGILGSAISAFLFFNSGLYSEGILYVIYVMFGFYGLMKWQQDSGEGIQILNSRFHWILIGLATSVGLITGWLMDRFSQAALPVADAMSSAFSLLATWLEARKVLHHWWYWMLINLFSIWLYAQRELYVLAAQMLLFFLLSVWGWFRWKRNFDAQ